MFILVLLSCETHAPLASASACQAVAPSACEATSSVAYWQVLPLARQAPLLSYISLSHPGVRIAFANHALAGLKSLAAVRRAQGGSREKPAQCVCVCVVVAPIRRAQCGPSVCRRAQACGCERSNLRYLLCPNFLLAPAGLGFKRPLRLARWITGGAHRVLPDGHVQMGKAGSFDNLESFKIWTHSGASRRLDLQQLYLVTTASPKGLQILASRCK